MTDTDSLAKVVAEQPLGATIPKILAILRDSAAWEDDSDFMLASGLADHIERLDAEMRKEVESAQRWRDLHKASADTERAAADDAIAEIATLRARLAACEKVTDEMIDAAMQLDPLDMETTDRVREILEVVLAAQSSAKGVG